MRNKKTTSLVKELWKSAKICIFCDVILINVALSEPIYTYFPIYDYYTFRIRPEIESNVFCYYWKRGF